MTLSLQQFGLAALQKSGAFELWDAFYYPTWQERADRSLIEAFDAERAVADRFRITRQCALLHVGLGTAEGASENRIRANPEPLRELLRQRVGRLLGIARLNANDVPGSLTAIEEWVVRGPMVGVCFPAGGQPGSLECNHPNFDPLVRAAAAAGGLILQMNRYVTGEKDAPTLSTPAKLAELAGRHPDILFVSGHAGGDWEKGIRAVRARPNILVETSGFDPTAGFIEMAVRELGAQRIVFGTHLPGRSLGTECAKILAARITDAEKALIFSGNVRRLLSGVCEKKGIT